jgi:hypothetical protein
MPRMPRYFFNVHHARSHLDTEGAEFPDLSAAFREATRTTGEVLRYRDTALAPGQDWRLEVTDEFENVIYVIRVNAEQPG